MKLYAFTTSEISKHNGYLKIGETNGDVEKRVDQECHELNVQKEIVWRDAVITERSHIDKMIHRYLVNQGFQIQQFDTTGQDTKWVQCTVADVAKAFAIVKQQLYNDEIQRQNVCNEFYEKIRNWFYWTAKTGNGSPKNLTLSVAEPEYTLRLIVRLLLCFFLQDKGIIPKELFDKTFIEQNLKEDEEYRYYNAILRNLFFHCLNTPIRDRSEVEHKKLFKNIRNIKEQFQKVPFLNGGLFYEHSGDDLPLNHEHFFSELTTRYILELGGNYKVEGIIRILSQYQYKLSIDDLFDREYTQTVDPEFIGKVFESLLACIDANTQKNRRKTTGSFYTPREIVDYMVGKSLDAYLQNDSGKDLLQCKVLDPACGSGAFPCGVMNEIIRRIDPDKQFSQQERYRKKLKILQNVIYGVDIQPMAVQITTLRMFLSLIQEVIPDKKKENYGIEPLPNLETKFICANALIGLEKEKQRFLVSPSIKIAVEMLKNNRDQYVTASTLQDKQRIQEYDEKLRHSFSQLLETETIFSHDTVEHLLKWNPYNQTKASPFFDPQWMFGITDGFDIVIGNPPYVSAPTMVDTNPQGRQAVIDSKRFTTLYQKWDLYIPFMEFGLQLLKENGLLTMIVPYPLTNQTYAKKMRELIVNNYNLIEIVDLNGTKIFENATVSNCIPFILKSKPNKNCYISHINEQKKITHTFKQNYSNLVQDDKTSVWNLTKEKRETNRHSGMNVLGDFCYISVGMVLNADEKTARGEFTKDDLISETYDKIHCRKYIEAKDIERYVVKKIHYLEYNTERCPDKLRRPTFRELYELPKLMFNRLGNLQVFLDSETRFLHSDSMFSAILWKDLKEVDNKSISASVKRYSKHSRKEMELWSETIDLRYLLGILNSKYASVLLSNLRGGDYHIYPEHLRNLPVSKTSLNQQRFINSLVDQVLSMKKKNPMADTSDLESQIDAIVFLLYGLTESEMINVLLSMPLVSESERRRIQAHYKDYKRKQ
ncbi:MAG: N-6 DNA methylase [Planctomycetaceae bacterium]|jgi:type I restriction-modification system DNA methylase subunit|nr:N-6 DNA methylase [Planctomycetaceae bacterium]